MLLANQNEKVRNYASIVVGRVLDILISFETMVIYKDSKKRIHNKLLLIEYKMKYKNWDRDLYSF